MSPSPCERIYHRTLHTSGKLLTETGKVCVSRNRLSQIRISSVSRYFLCSLDETGGLAALTSEPLGAKLEPSFKQRSRVAIEAGYGEDISKDNYHCKIIELLLLMSE